MKRLTKEEKLSKKNTGFRIEDVPQEVMYAWAIEWSSQYEMGIGSGLMKEYQDIVDKYPEWFKQRVEAFDKALENECFYIPDDTTAMNCVVCGRSKFLHKNNHINNLT